MNLACRFFVPWLLLLPTAPLAAETIVCDDLRQLAAEIHDLRDEDANAGVARGEALLKSVR